jgi:hypothetical protein
MYYGVFDFDGITPDFIDRVINDIFYTLSLTQFDNAAIFLYWVPHFHVFFLIVSSWCELYPAHIPYLVYFGSSDSAYLKHSSRTQHWVSHMCMAAFRSFLPLA